MSVSENLKQARVRCELSYADLSRLTGIAKSTLQRYETGATLKIPFHAIEKISIALKTSPQLLLGWKSNEDRKDENLKASKQKLRNLSSEKKSSHKDDIVPLDFANTSDEKDIEKMICQLKKRLMMPGVTFEGKPVPPESIQSILDAMQIGMEIARKRIREKNSSDS